MTNAIALLAFAASAVFFLWPSLRGTDRWRATVTPLASIIGSGFLVSLPLITDLAGSAAIVVMAALVLFSYALGHAIRFNIAHGEKLFDARKPVGLFALERTSHLVLAGAYFISVTYYLSLLSAFLLKGVGIVAPDMARLLTTSALILMGGFGFWRGLHALEAVEEYAVGLKLAVIAAVIAALAYYNVSEAVQGRWALPEQVPPQDWHSLKSMLGLLIVVQGFETSRFLKGVYPPDMRVRTMRWAQWIAAGIYLCFFGLAAILGKPQGDPSDVAAVTTMLGGVAGTLVILLTAGAVFAQASAAIADAIGSAGLLVEAADQKFKRRYAYPLIAAVGIALCWSVDILQVISYASRAFAAYYALQCLVAARVALEAKDGAGRALHIAGYGLLAVLAIAVVIFGIPAEAGG